VDSLCSSYPYSQELGCSNMKMSSQMFTSLLWRKMHNELLHILYSFPNIIRQIKSRRVRCVGCVEFVGEKTNVYKVLMGKPEGKRPLGRPRCRCDQNGS
jgi:hypothetical protein